MTKLNLDTFNDLLFSAFEELTPEKKKELLEMEFHILFDVFCGRLCDLCDELTEIGYTSDLFEEISNLRSNGEDLLEQIKDLEEQIAEEAAE